MKKRAVELEGRKRESTLKFHDGFLSRYRPEKGEWRENSKVERREREKKRSEKGVNFSPKILPPHTLEYTSHTAHAAVTSPLG